MLFAGGEETVERKGIFAYMSVGEKSDFGVEFTESGEGGEGNGDEIADAADIENDLIGALFEEATAKKSDHRMKVLPGKCDGVNKVELAGRSREQKEPAGCPRQSMSGRATVVKAAAGLSHLKNQRE